MSFALFTHQKQFIRAVASMAIALMEDHTDPEAVLPPPLRLVGFMLAADPHTALNAESCHQDLKKLGGFPGLAQLMDWNAGAYPMVLIDFLTIDQLREELGRL